MGTRMSLLRFEESLRDSERDFLFDTPFVQFDNFSYEICKHAFSIPTEEIGIIESIFLAEPTEIERGTIDRLAKVVVKKEIEYGEERDFFFYIFAVEESNLFPNWKIIGRSNLRSSSIDLPDYENEMIWLD